MLRIRVLIMISLFTLCAVNGAIAQEIKPIQSASAPTITVAASADRVRFTAPNTVVQMHLQVYDNAGQLVFDVSSKGNVLDWTLQDSGGARLNPGSYLSVVTVKSLSGKLSQRIGSVSVQEKELELQRVDATQLTAGQQQAVGPIEENGALTIVNAGDAEATTVIAHDGTQGEITRSRGALSFRLGDFFSGKDTEQMRLTEEGNLGIGTDNPQAKLDVAGVIRTSKGIEFASGPEGTNVTKLTTTATGSLQQTLADGTIVPNATGSGTQNKLAKWTDNAGTLGDSVVTEVSGNIGIGTPTPQAALHVIGNQFLKPVGATPTYEVLAGSDPTTTVMLTTDSAGFGWQIAPSNVASETIVQVLGQFFAAVPNRGEFGIYLGADPNSAFKVIQRGGPELIRVNRTGDVGIGTPAPTAVLHVVGPQPPPPVSSGKGTNASRVLQVIGGKGGDTTDTNGFNGFAAPGGVGASVLIQAGNGGDNLNTSGAFFESGKGGSITLQPGLSGFAGPFPRDPSFAGNVLLVPSGGNVGIGPLPPPLNFATPPTHKLEVSGGGFGANAQITDSNTTATTVDIDNSSAGGGRWRLQSVGSGVAGRVGNFEIWSHDGGVGNVLTVQPAGNVGIGTTAPQAKLHVLSGSICAGLFCDNSEGRIIAGGGAGEITFLDRGATSFVGVPANGERWTWYGSSGRARLWSGADKLSVEPSGNLRVAGTVTASTTPDLAETIAADESVTAGDIVCADPRHTERAVRCAKHDRAILGVISDGSGGFLINSRASSPDAPLTGKPLVLAGRVPVKVSLENGPIQIGDFLSPSSRPGLAMRATEFGPTIGIALEAFNGETANGGRQTGAVLCFLKAGDGNATAALTRMNREHARLQQENAALNARLGRLEQQQNQIAALRTANTALNARLRAVEKHFQKRQAAKLTS